MAVEGFVAELLIMIELIGMVVDSEAEFEAVATNPVEIDAVENAVSFIVSNLTSETDAASTTGVDGPADLVLLVLLDT